MAVAFVCTKFLDSDSYTLYDAQTLPSSQIRETIFIPKTDRIADVATSSPRHSILVKYEGRARWARLKNGSLCHASHMK
jgi:hypothetical protein